MNKRSVGDTKEAILAATRKVFAEQGYEQASMRAIAQMAGLSVGGLYLYFKNKEELYVTLTQEWMTELHAATVLALDGLADPREAIATFIRLSITYATRRREMILLQGKDLGFSCGTDLKREFFRQRRALLVTIIERGIAAGVFRDVDPEEAAKVVFSALRGFVVSMLFDEDALFEPEACADLVVNGLTRRN
ncbi:MAG TPA: TetR/AcrR family transcriptional regulator [Geobacteraceae bacterium]